ncbi:hypothetical protein D2T31_19735 [Sinirhodobacter populi]|uniref:O-antigen ligase domain-containing protein n=1 Tax=Paenirhodobacter populi TaxID=2306993 RepID=A0A443K199_9RHOB|nr:hypothetical protein [Sinirhodobacter populi]RWR26528.1 hypothetical protein D2T31_19735 [Sinirhodobacter populi]
MMMLAQIVLYSWPLVAWFLFRKLRPEPALIATILLGYLFIPERVGYDPPLLPPINKHLMPLLCAAVGMWMIRRREALAAERAARRQAAAEGKPEAPRNRRPPRRHRSWITRIIPLITGVLLVNTVFTWQTNQEPIFYTTSVLAGIRPYDVGSMSLSVLTMLLPLWLGLRYLRSREAMTDLLKVLVWCGFAYSFLILWESRMSPRLNVQLYGFFAHSWIQHVRDGFRPIVFLAHGLRVGIFLAMAALAAAVLARNNTDGKRGRWLALALWLLFCLPISRNFGATMITFALMPVILFTPTRIQFVIGLVIAATVLIFPLARGSGLIPADRIVAAIMTINPERAGSLQFRLDQEDILLAKANQKPVSGWGGWGRSRVYNDDTGRDESITDGSWIIVIGTSGWIGYLGTFGLLCLPVILAALRFRRFELGTVESGTAIVLCANLIDLIPNSSLLPLIWLIAGTIWGRLIQTSTQLAENRAKDSKRAPHGRVRRAPERRPAVHSANSTPSNT